MAYETRDNSGSTFPNDRKESENHPDQTGRCMVGGKLYYMSTWKKVTKDGRPWESHSFKAADEAKTPAPAGHAGQSRDSQFRDLSDDFDDAIPF